MPVAFDAAATPKVTNSTSVTISLVVTPGACLVVNASLKNIAGLSVSAVYANGVQMTQLTRVENAAVGASPISVHLFVLTSSPSGTVSISANIVGANQLMALGACSYTGHRSTNPFSAIAVATAGNVASTNFTISHSSGDRVVLLGGCTNSISSNCTVRAADGGNMGFYMGDTAGPNTVTSDGFSFSTSQSVGAANYIHTYIALNIAAPRASATMTLANFCRLLKDVGY